MEEMKSVYKILVGKSTEKRLLGRSRCIWEDKIEMNVAKWGGGLSIEFMWHRISADGGVL
jgi:hypothetical protein